jgi:hypothetical protein
MTSSSLIIDLYLSVGFGMAIIGVVLHQIWFIFGGFLIFYMGIMDIKPNSSEDEGVSSSGTEEVQDPLRTEGGQVSHEEDQRRRDEEILLLKT